MSRRQRYGRILGKKYVPRGERIAFTLGDRSWTWSELGDMGIYNPIAPRLLEFALEKLGVSSTWRFIHMIPAEISLYSAGDETGFVAMQFYAHLTHKDPVKWVARGEKPVRWTTYKRRQKKEKRRHMRAA